MGAQLSDLDDQVRLAVYRHFVDDGRPPVAAQVAAALDMSTADAEDSFRRLADARVLVLAPGTPYIWMANPLCALPSPFKVTALGRPWWGTCIWDSLGILAMLDSDGTVETTCPDCSEPMKLTVTDGVISGGGVVHYAVPANKWWDSIGFT